MNEKRIECPCGRTFVGDPMKAKECEDCRAYTGSSFGVKSDDCDRSFLPPRGGFTKPNMDWSPKTEGESLGGVA